MNSKAIAQTNENVSPDARLDISDLRTIVAVAEMGSFSEAAGTGMSQPGVLLRIARLEERLGIRILHRRKPLELTDPGLRIFNQARPAIQQFDKVLSTPKSLNSKIVHTPMAC